ncbi:hypothetical protein BDZ89DRAFT_1064062 [Hymenopellis radicata]|nr:hypothetical protein BDZ89DRAFT_1064062 [Hymenopellis radicata]
MELARMRWARFRSRRPVGSTITPRADSVVGAGEVDSYKPPLPPLAFGEYRRPTGVRTRRSPKVEAAAPAVEEEKVESAHQSESVESTPKVESTPQSEAVASTSESETVASTSESETVTSTPQAAPVASTPQVETTQNTTPIVDASTVTATTAAPIATAAPPKPRSHAAAPQRPPRRSPHLEAAKAQEKSVLTMIRKKESKGPKKATPDVLVKARQQQQKHSQQKQKQPQQNQKQPQQPQKQASAQDQTMVSKLKSSLFGSWFQ